MRIKRLNESFDKSPINIEKLKRYALGILICCAGEYGDTFFREPNEIFINLGDSSPFKDEDLEMYIKDAVSDSWDSSKEIKVTIENECGPSGDGWKIYDPKSKDFVAWNGW